MKKAKKIRGDKVSSTKYAVMSMDIEDWYHLNYFLGKAPADYSMLDGFSNYVDILNKNEIKTTFFVLSELADQVREELRYAVSCGHEIACHGKTHVRPLDMEPKKFKEEITQAKAALEDLTGKEVIGYRAPCYGIDDERYEIVKAAGFKYSSSRMDVPNHPLYGEIDLSTYSQPIKGIYYKDGFAEFSLSTQPVMGKHIAVSGGGWIRILPWNMFMKPLIKAYLKNAESYSLYIHPFELSQREMPAVDNTGFLTNVRARRGLGKVDKRVEELIALLESNSFKFATFGEIYSALSENEAAFQLK